MKSKLNFLCLDCGRMELVEVKQATILKGAARCYFPPQGWALFYPPNRFPAWSGVCDKCVSKVLATAEPTKEKGK